jgi:high-affinity iron transporter
MLLFLGAGLFQTGVDKLIDKEILPTLVDQLWNTSALLDDSSTFGSLVATLTGYRAHPALMNLIAYAVYWGVVYLLVRRANRLPAQRAAGRAA